jgi:hypothetical protein
VADTSLLGPGLSKAGKFPTPVSHHEDLAKKVNEVKSKSTGSIRSAFLTHRHHQVPAQEGPLPRCRHRTRQHGGGPDRRRRSYISLRVFESACADSKNAMMSINFLVSLLKKQVSRFGDRWLDSY